MRRFAVSRLLFAGVAFSAGFIFAFAAAAQQQQVNQPSVATTVARETANNTSASPNFSGQTNGRDLSPLATLQKGEHKLDLSRLHLAPGQYSLFVKMVGRPLIANHLSPPVAYIVKE